jgi:hypothetical protein
MPERRSRSTYAPEQRWVITRIRDEDRRHVEDLLCDVSCFLLQLALGCILGRLAVVDET